MSRLERITIDPAIRHGQRTVRGLRYPVENLLEDHRDLERQDLLAALEFEALASGQRWMVPLGAS